MKKWTLDKILDRWSYAFHNTSNIEARKKCRDNYLFYYGMNNKQWDTESLAVLQDNGMKPLTFNMVRSCIDNVTGVEIQNRFVSTARSRIVNPEADMLAEGISSLLYARQEMMNAPYKQSLQFRDAVISGEGWVKFYRDERGQYALEYVPACNVVPDPDDITPQRENMQYVFHVHFVPLHEARSLWPRAFSNASDLMPSGGMVSDELLYRSSSLSVGSHSSGTTALIIECQYKVIDTVYCGHSENGIQFKTFYEDEAIRLAGGEDKIKEEKATRIMSALFCPDLCHEILEEGPLRFLAPDSDDFGLIPLVWDRDFETGVPIAPLDSMKPVQIMANSCLTRENYLMYSSRFAVTGQTLSQMDVDRLEEKVKNPSFLLNFPRDSDIKDFTPRRSAGDFVGLMNFFREQIMSAAGVNAEMMGMPSNATSGIAQNIRQVNGIRTNVFGFERFSQAKKRLGKIMAGALLSDFDYDINVKLMGREDADSIILNQMPLDKQGRVVNDVRCFPVDIFIDENPLMKSQKEVMGQTLLSIAQSGATWLIQNEELASMLGIPRNVVKSFNQTMQSNAAMQQGVAGHGSVQEGVASPQAPSIPQIQTPM